MPIVQSKLNLVGVHFFFKFVKLNITKLTLLSIFNKNNFPKIPILNTKDQYHAYHFSWSSQNCYRQ